MTPSCQPLPFVIGLILAASAGGQDWIEPRRQGGEGGSGGWVDTLEDPSSPPIAIESAMHQITGWRGEWVTPLLLDQLARKDVTSMHGTWDYKGVRKEARRLLEQYGVPVLEALIARLEHGDPRVRSLGAAALGNEERLDSMAVNALARHVRDVSAAVSHESIRAIRRAGLPTVPVIEALVAVCLDRSSTQGREAIEALGMLGDPGWKRLHELYRQGDRTLRHLVMSTIRHQYLQGDPPGIVVVRGPTKVVLGGPRRPRPPVLVELLCAGLDDESERIRTEAAATLGDLGMDAVSATTQLADHRWGTSRNEGLEPALEAIGGAARSEGQTLAYLLPRLLVRELLSFVGVVLTWVLLVRRLACSWTRRWARVFAAAIPVGLFTLAVVEVIAQTAWVQAFLPVEPGSGNVVSVAHAISASTVLLCSLLSVSLCWSPAPARD